MWSNSIRKRKLYDIIEQLTSKLASVYPCIMTSYKMPGTEDVVIEVENRFFLAYPWVKGNILEFSKINFQHISVI